MSATRMSRIAAGCLLAAAAANLTGVALFNLRDGVNSAPPQNLWYLVERGLFMAGMVVSALGFYLLADRDRDSVLLRIGTLVYSRLGWSALWARL